MDHHESMWAKAAKASLVQCDHSYGLAMESKANEGHRAEWSEKWEEDQDNFVIRKDREEKV